MQSDNPQVVQKTTNTTNKSPYKFVMPGLCPEITYEFRRKRGVIPHARTIAMNSGIESSAVYPALIHTLFDRVEALERRLGGSGQPFLVRRSA